MNLNSAIIFKDGENYIVTILDRSGNISGIAIFSSDRKLLRAEGITPINAENIGRFVGKTIKELEKQYGNIHCDTGSGRYIPAYFTDNASIVFFGVSDIESEPIESISLEDIITG